MNNRPSTYNPQQDPTLIQFYAALNQEVPLNIQALTDQYAHTAREYSRLADVARGTYNDLSEANAMMAFMGGGMTLPVVNNGSREYKLAIHFYSKTVALGNPAHLVDLANVILNGDHSHQGDQAAVYFRIAHEHKIAGAKEGFEKLKYYSGDYIDYHQIFVNESVKTKNKFNELARKHSSTFKHIMLTSRDSWERVKDLLHPEVTEKLLHRDVNLQVRLQTTAKLPDVLADIVMDYAEATTFERDIKLKKDIQTAVNLQIQREGEAEVKLSDSRHSILFAFKSKREAVVKKQEALRASDTWLWNQPIK